MELRELRIVVTGAASGLGHHFCERLLAAGAAVVGADVNRDGMRSLQATATDHGTSFEAFETDVRNEDEVDLLFETARSAIGPVNALVNAAGIVEDALLVRRDRESGRIDPFSAESFRRVVDVCLTGTFLCTRAFAKRAVEDGTSPGVVVNLSSISRHGNLGQSSYSAAKAGVVADTVVWAKELARYGIRVAAIAPGFIETPMLSRMRPEILDRIVEAVPLRRRGTPEEIWRALQFVIECDYVTGSCIDVDGGLRL